MPVTRSPYLKIGSLVQACEDGYAAGLRGSAAVCPKRFWQSPKLERAFWTGYDLARRYEGATDGPAR